MRVEGPLFEYACNEGNTGMNGIAAATAESRQGDQVRRARASNFPQTGYSPRGAAFLQALFGNWVIGIKLTKNALIRPILRKRRFITACVYSEFHVRCIYRGGHGGGLKGVVLVVTERYRESSSVKQHQIPFAPVAP